jgi:hypothetical protein
MQEQILELESLINQEIEEYKNIEKLYIDKKEILIKADGEKLLGIDSLILDAVQNVNNISTKRKSLSEKMNIMTGSMSEIIGFVKSKDKTMAQRFEEKKKEINRLSERLADLDRVNAALAQHGIQLTNKTLEVILKGLAVPNQEYNKHGQSVSPEQPEMSSIVEEA